MESIRVNGRTFVPFLSEAELDKAITVLAERLNTDFHDKRPVFVGVLNGSFMFVSDLFKKLTIECELSFIKLASYHGTESTGQVNQLIGLNQDLTDRHVVILEDIVDTGSTLEFLLDIFKTHDTASLSVATLLLKPDVFKKKYPVRYVGLDIPNKFVIGYGLDFDGLARNLKSVYQLAEE